MHAGVFMSSFKNKMNHLQEYNRVIAFTSAGLSLGCLIGYFIGKIRRYQPLLEDTAKIVKMNDDNKEEPYYKGMKLITRLLVEKDEIVFNILMTIAMFNVYIGMIKRIQIQIST